MERGGKDTLGDRYLEAEKHFIKMNLALFVGAIAATVELPAGLILGGVAAYQFKKMCDAFKPPQGKLNK